MFKLLTLTALFTSALAASSLTLPEYEDAFRKNGIVPDVIPAIKFTSFFDLTYGTIQVTPGINLTKQDTASQPLFSIRPGTSGGTVTGKNYVIIAVDPDAPSPQNRSLSDIIHFIGGGFKAGGSGNSVLSNSTPAVLDYLPPGPPPTSAAHRYTFLLFESTPQFEKQALVDSSTSRLQFSLPKFIEATQLGPPIGGTFFYESTNPAEVTSRPSTSPTSTPRSAGNIVTIPFSFLIAAFMMLLVR